MRKIFLGSLLTMLSSGAVASQINGIILVPQSVPAISQAGLIALAFIVGIIGARLIGKVKSTNS